jgi:hypothetical protein
LTSADVLSIIRSITFADLLFVRDSLSYTDLLFIIDSSSKRVEKREGRSMKEDERKEAS